MWSCPLSSRSCTNPGGNLCSEPPQLLCWDTCPQAGWGFFRAPVNSQWCYPTSPRSRAVGIQLLKGKYHQKPKLSAMETTTSNNVVSSSSGLNYPRYSQGWGSAGGSYIKKSGLGRSCVEWKGGISFKVRICFKVGKK